MSQDVTICDRAVVVVLADQIALGVGNSGEDEPREMVVMDAGEARRLSRALSEAAGFLSHPRPTAARRRR